MDAILTAPSPPSFREYVDTVTHGRFEWYRHAEILADRLQDVADGRLKRLMVFMPPRHGKSEEVSRLFPGYYLTRHPVRNVGVCSYAANKAYEFSRAARGFYRESGNLLSDESSAVHQWSTAEGGSAWWAGVGGPLTGFGGHLLVIDDPIKNQRDADSELVRTTQKEWWESTFRTRLEPDGAIVIVLTRWHEDDLAGWLLEREQDPEAQENWHIVCFPAEAEDEMHTWPESCTVEPEWRQPGEPLCPERYPLEALRVPKSSARSWAALYQQRPRPREGSFFKYEWFQMVDAKPAEARRIRYWDTAGTDGDGDYTAGVLMARAGDVFWVEDVVRGQWSPGARDARIVETAKRDGKDVVVWLEQEAGVAGTDRTKALIGKLAGFRVQSERPTGPKESRADPLASQAEAGNVRVLNAPWTNAFLDELCAFPLGKHDDQVDAVSGAFNKLALVEPMEIVPMRWF